VTFAKKEPKEIEHSSLNSLSRSLSSECGEKRELLAQEQSEQTQKKATTKSSWSYKVQEGKKDKQVNEFILLQDLTHEIEFPSILDLKMGKRQHGLEASPQKKQRQIQRCKETTSFSLGLRMCGMQVSFE